MFLPWTQAVKICVAATASLWFQSFARHQGQACAPVSHKLLPGFSIFRAPTTERAASALVRVSYFVALVLSLERPRVSHLSHACLNIAPLQQRRNSASRAEILGKMMYPGRSIKAGGPDEALKGSCARSSNPLLLFSTNTYVHVVTFNIVIVQPSYVCTTAVV